MQKSLAGFKVIGSLLRLLKNWLTFTALLKTITIVFNEQRLFLGTQNSFIESHSGIRGCSLFGRESIKQDGKQQEKVPSISHSRPGPHPDPPFPLRQQLPRRSLFWLLLYLFCLSSRVWTHNIVSNYNTPASPFT